MKHIYDNSHHKSSEERFTERFREVAQNYEPAFEPADWSAMQSKLAAHNEKNRRKVVFRRLAIWASMGAAAVVLLFGGYQFLDNSANEVSNGNIAINTKIDNKITKNKKTTISRADLQNSTSPSTINKINEETTTQSQLVKTQNFAKTKSFSNTQESKTTNNLSQLAQNQVANIATYSISDNILLENTDTSIEETLASNTDVAFLKTEKPNIDIFFNPEAKEVTLPQIEITTLASANQTEEIVRKNPVASAIGKWRLGTALMAMANLYKSNNEQKINYANGYGLMADRQISKRFNISAGAIYTQKRIDIEEPLTIPTVANSFNPDASDAAWIRKNKTQVNWQLLDIPVNLRYNAIQTDRNKWFVSAGTSNYFFLKEKYESDYTVSVQDTYDPRLTRTQEIVRQRETQSALQLFATINVSAGIETSLGKHLTLQVEPYWRFPVRSLGSEGVFVQTGGLLTRINFAL